MEDNFLTDSVGEGFGMFQVQSTYCALFLFRGGSVGSLYLTNFLVGYEGDSLARFSHCFFLLSFSSLLGLKPGHN